MARKAKAKDEVICRTYGQDQKFPTRSSAIEFFKEAMMCSEGSEQQRYVQVYLQLLDGKSFCTDEDEIELGVV